MASSRIRYVKDIAGTNKLMTSPEMVALMEKRAREGAAYAQGISPTATGEYEQAFEVTSVRRGGPRKNRAEARLSNGAAYARDVERRHRVLGRTVDVIERGG